MFTKFMQEQSEAMERTAREMGDLDMDQIKGPQKEPQAGDTLFGEMPEDIRRLLALARKADKKVRRIEKEADKLIFQNPSQSVLQDLQNRLMEAQNEAVRLWTLLQCSILEEYESLFETHLGDGRTKVELVYCSGWRLFVRPVPAGSRPTMSDITAELLQSFCIANSVGLPGNNGFDPSQGEPHRQSHSWPQQPSGIGS